VRRDEEGERGEEEEEVEEEVRLIDRLTFRSRFSLSLLEHFLSLRFPLQTHQTKVAAAPQRPASGAGP